MGVFDDIGQGLSRAGDSIREGVDDSVRSGMQHVAEAGRAVGQGLDRATDNAGGLLARTGFTDAADAVRGWGDEAASDLGATPAERQLGQTEDPKELIHGGPERIRASSQHLRDFHKAFDNVGQGMRKVNSSHWKGWAGETFREKFQTHPTKWLEAADACERAAGALEAYADTVKWAQAKAQEAIDLYKSGAQASRTATDAYNARVDAYNAKVRSRQDPGPRPESFTDPGTADMQRAQELLADARRGRDEAASRAESAVQGALAHAPAAPPPASRLGNQFLDVLKATSTELNRVPGGTIRGAAGLVGFVTGLNPTTPYNLGHPAEWFQGVSTTLAGLVSTASHPERAVKTALDSLAKSPGDFGGRLIFEALGTKGAGFARTGLRLGVDGLRDGVNRLLGRGVRKEVETRPEVGARQTCQKTCVKDPIDVATGHMLLPQVDIRLPGSLPLEFRRQFESSYRIGRWFGPTWSSTIDQRLEIDAIGVVFVGEDGLLLSYPHPAPGVPTLPHHGSPWPLDRTEDGYTLTDPDTGQVRHFVDQGDGLAILEQIDDRNGHWVTIAHDPDGTPLSMTHSGGYRLSFTTADGHVTALHLAGAAPDGTDQELVRYGYSAEGHLAEVTTSSGLPTRFGYDDQGRLTSWTDTNDTHFTYAYDDQDRCTHQSGSAGHMQATFAYGATDPATGHHTVTVTDSHGHRTRYLINERCQVIAESDPLGAVTRYTRDGRHRLLSVTDPLGHTTQVEHDEAGQPVTVVRPDGRATGAGYNDLGLPVKIVHPDGTVVRQTYDERGNRTSVTDPSGGTTRYAYDEAGHLASVTDAAGHRTLVRCDRAGLPVEITDPLGAVTRYDRDAFGRPSLITDPLGATTRLEWTVEGHLARRTAPDGAVESWTYDGEGNCTTHTDAAGAVTRFDYGDFDLLTARTDPDGVRYTFDHDTESRLTRVTNPQGLTWDYTYDPAGRPIAETDFDDRTLTYRYDAAGRLASRTNVLDETVTFERDVLGRVTRKDAAGRVTTYAYDFTGRLAQTTGPDSSLTVLRDHLGRVQSETVDGRVLTYTYDQLGRRTGRVTPSGAASTWTYDAAGRPERLTVGDRTLDFGYDAAGREVARRLGEAVRLEQSFDPAGRLTAQLLTAPDHPSRPLRSRAYRYRPDGHLTGIEDRLAGTTRSFDLDPTGRVTAVHAAGWTERYAYDEAGNQTSASWPDRHPGHEATGERTYEGTRITRAGRVRYAHDALGRITLRQRTRLSRRPDTWRYEWDPEDRLIAVVTPDGTRWRYTYDALGRRTGKQRLAADGETVVERTDFTWDGSTLCEQTTTSEAVPQAVTLTWDHRGLTPLAQTERIARAVRPTPDGTLPAPRPASGLSLLAEDEDDPIAPVEDDETASRFFAIVTDLIGTPTELVADDGTVAWHTRATLWGTTTWNRTATAYTPLRFPGQYYDPETGLHYNHFRTYDPETGRYLSADPLGLAPAPNPTLYVGNPHRWADPLGLTATGCPPGYSGKKGKEGEARAIQELQDRGYTIMGEHVKLEAKDGTTSYVDIVATGNGPGLGAPEFFEVKNGPGATLSRPQKIVYGQLADAGGVILRSDKLTDWGLEPGDLLGPSDVKMILYGGAKAW
ncbi:putative T7SS-secreted protein [Streptomyces odontomachi]|uniref:putative T7SS-secreted protein n=1 Tax=Streptomyces odontomachi TaxID=2944940 RepID=UPI002108EB96|nr:RHS repeat-associated core domain-containing protein [Streptomyces sp. ODS25]